MDYEKRKLFLRNYYFWHREIKSCSSLEELFLVKRKFFEDVFYNQTDKSRRRPSYLTLRDFFLMILDSKADEEKKMFGIMANSLKKIFVKYYSLRRLSFFLSRSVRILKKSSFFFRDKTRCVPGKLHPLHFTKAKILSWLVKRGLIKLKSIEVDDWKNNFQLLNISREHEAWGVKDTFWIEKEKRLLRTHATNVTARILKLLATSLSPSFLAACLPLGFFNLGEVFRRDVESSSHLLQFNQLDLVILGKKESISSAFLFSFLKTFFLEVFGINEQKIVFRRSYFPFTRPSFEVDLKCFCGENLFSSHPLRQKRCSFCKGTGFIEVAGCGMIRDVVFKKVGFNQPFREELSAIAVGLGIERVLSFVLKLQDIRLFYSSPPLDSN